MIKSLNVPAIFALTTVFSLAVQAQNEQQRAAIEERIKPHGEVCLQGDSRCGGTGAAGASAARSGEDVYNAACAACHTSGIAGAPKLGNAGDWGDRIAKGIDVLYDSGITGLAGTGMIAKGGCANCSDDEIRASVDYLVDSVK